MIVLFFWLMSLILVRRAFNRHEWRYIWASFVMHVAFTVVMVAWSEVNQGGGDMLGYIYDGRFLAQMMRIDPTRAIPVVLRVLVQDDSVIDLVSSAGNPTGSMKALSGLMMFVANDSTYASSLVMTSLSFYGKLALYSVFRRSLHEALRGRMLVATLLVPSCVFWSCGLVKETVAITSLGLLLLGAHSIAARRWVVGAILLTAGTAYVGLIKPYVLFPFAMAGTLYVRAVWQPKAYGATSAPLRDASGLLVGVFGAVLLVALLGSFFPRYGVDKVSEEARTSQENAAALMEAKSNYSLGEVPQSFGGQVARAPVAFLTALFRPFPFEATGVTSLVCSLETVTLFILAVRALRRRALRETWRTLRATPLLTFSALYTLLFGTAVGLSTLNFGTLSRYRIPLMPFYTAIVLVLNAADPLGQDVSSDDEEADGEGAETDERGGP